MRDALTPSLACAAAHAGDLEALQALAEWVSPWGCEPGLGGRVVFLGLHRAPCRATRRGSQLRRRGAQWRCRAPPRGTPPACPFPGAHLTCQPSAVGTCPTSPQGSDLSLEDLQGQTPLHAAARRGHTAAVSLLLRSGAAVDARDPEGLSPLLLAVRGRYRPACTCGQGPGPSTSGGGASSGPAARCQAPGWVGTGALGQAQPARRRQECLRVGPTPCFSEAGAKPGCVWGARGVSSREGAEDTGWRGSGVSCPAAGPEPGASGRAAMRGCTCGAAR